MLLSSSSPPHQICLLSCSFYFNIIDYCGSCILSVLSLRCLSDTPIAFKLKFIVLPLEEHIVSIIVIQSFEYEYAVKYDSRVCFDLIPLVLQVLVFHYNVAATIEVDAQKALYALCNFQYGTKNIFSFFPFAAKLIKYFAESIEIWLETKNKIKKTVNCTVIPDKPNKCILLLASQLAEYCLETNADHESH